MLQLIITYIWFGLNIPQDYLIELGKVDYPIQILLNPIFNTSLKLNIQKSDRYRLQILKQGGIYADFDTKINYTCLMNHLQNFTGQMAIMQKVNDKNLNNNFIYVPHNRTRLINKILNQNPNYKEDCDTTVTGCNGPSLLWKYQNQITILNLTSCIYHSFDFSWWKDAGVVTNDKTQPSDILKDKLTTKEYYKNKLKQGQQKMLQNQLNKKIERLQKELISNSNFVKVFIMLVLLILLPLIYYFVVNMKHIKKQDTPNDKITQVQLSDTNV